MGNEAILFLSHLIPHEIYEEVNTNSSNNMQDAANALQWHLVEGFNHNLNGKYDIINFLPIASFPRYYSKMLISGGFFEAGTQNKAYNVEFCNIKYVRRFSIEKNIYFKVSEWCKRHRNEKKVIIVYTLNSTALKVISRIKDKYTDVLVCAIVADLPEMINLSNQKGFFRRYVDKCLAKASYSNIEAVDKFVFLTKHMSDFLGNTKPYCVMEGIATDHFKEANIVECERNSIVKEILYTGTLHEKFGILHLIESFSLIDDPNYRLIICGSGDSEDKIREAAQIDSRIIFEGQCSRTKALAYQRSATVLVNPRMNNEDFTKYSFPSKNMEYLSSGTPLVAYKLDGIPDEYDDYINYPEDNTEQALANELIKICEMPSHQRLKRGNDAREFIIENKNSEVQTNKILQLIENK